MREKQQIANFIVFGLNRLGLEPMIYHVHTRGESANYYTSDAVLFGFYAISVRVYWPQYTQVVLIYLDLLHQMYPSNTPEYRK
jgi:hypothetical protein